MKPYANPQAMPYVADNMPVDLVEKIHTLIDGHIRAEREKLRDPEHEVLAVWKAFTDPTKIGFLTPERFNRALAEIPKEILSHIPHAFTVPLTGAAQRMIIANLFQHDGGHYLRKYGQMTKPGRMAAKLCPEADPAYIEAFALAWKTAFAPEELHIEVTSDVNRAYNTSHYAHTRGTILSCMVDKPHLTSFSKDAGAQAVLLLNQFNQICARALLWPEAHIHTEGTVRLMDRVYASKEHYYAHLFNWAAENNVYRKKRQNYEAKEDFVRPDGTPFSSTAHISDVPITRENGSYPYMDTFTYLDLDDRALWNTATYIADGFSLEGTDGWADPLTETVWVEGYGNVPEEDVVFDNYGNPIHRDDAVTVGANFYHRDDPDIIELENGDYVHIDDAICTENGEYYHREDPDLVSLENRSGIYHISDPEINDTIFYFDDLGGWYDTEGTDLEVHESSFHPGTYLSTEGARNRYDRIIQEHRDRQQLLIT